jgi:hypothetical protein
LVLGSVQVWPTKGETVLTLSLGDEGNMAIDGNLLTFLVAASLALMAAAVALPSKSRIESDPSTAFGPGRRALVMLASLLSLIIGLIMFRFAPSNLEALVADLNMVQIGGISLIVIGVVLLSSSAYIRRQVRRAGKGEDEMVMEVAAIARGPPPGIGAPPPRSNRAPRPMPPPRDRPVPPPRNDDIPPPPPRVARRPPPPRYPPPE